MFDPQIPASMLNRRRFLGNTTSQVGVAALATLLASSSRAEESAPKAHAALPGFLNFAPKAKRIIYLFQSGGSFANGPVRSEARVGETPR